MPNGVRFRRTSIIEKKVNVAMRIAVTYENEFSGDIMNIKYTTEKIFTEDQLQELFLSVGWLSGKYPKRLHKAMLHSSTVISAWVGEQLVGLVRVLDDSELVAFIHYVLVSPDYQGYGIASHMIEMVKEKYKDYLYRNHAGRKQKRRILPASWIQYYGRWRGNETQ